MKGAELAYGELGDFFKGLLEKNVVDALILPYRVGDSVSYMLVRDKDRIVAPESVIFAPSFGVNAANIVKGWLIDEKVGIVAKPCEIRAAIEMIKLKQLNEDSVLLIAVDCFGAYPNEVYAEHYAEIGDQVDAAKIKELAGKGISIRDACAICDNRLADVGDVVIARTSGDKVSVAGNSKIGEAALSSVGLELKDTDLERKAEKERIAAEAAANLEKLPIPDSQEALETFLRDCIVCKNCRDVCPVCYCKECFFDQPIGNPTGGDLLNLAEARGAIAVPVNQLLYHLTRVYHVSTTCVACGACEDACPKDIPLTRFYPVLTRKVQELFKYVPGKDVAEPLPFTTYEEEELEECLR
jgi:formate dehydrogenase subunit beta